MKQIAIPSYLDDKGCLLRVFSFEGGYVHQSWLLSENEVISYESIPDNYPSGTLCVWDSLEEYADAISSVSWINDPEYIVKNNMPEETGYPFTEEREE